MEGDMLKMRAKSINSFAAGLLVATSVFGAVYLFGTIEEKVEITEASEVEEIKEEKPQKQIKKNNQRSRRTRGRKPKK